MPVRIGPITVAPAISCISLTEILAECRAGTTNMFAGPVKRQKGYASIAFIFRATSAVISPSYSKLTDLASSSAGARYIFSARSDTGWPNVEKLTNATLGSKPNWRATTAAFSAISARSFSLGHSWTKVSLINIILPL